MTSVCEMCGVTENLEEHYSSYVPRIVILLCQNCHRNEHKKASSDSDTKRTRARGEEHHMITTDEDLKTRA